MAKEIFVYIGTYSGGGSRGIYCVKLDADHGTLSEPVLAAEQQDPGFLRISDGILYCTGDPDGEGDKYCTVASYRIGQDDGRLQRISSRQVDKLRFCHISLADNGRVLLGADYRHGKTAAFLLGTEGEIDAVAAVLVYAGASGVNPERQMEPHVHSITPYTKPGYAFVCDFSADAVRCYKTSFEDTSCELSLNDSLFVAAGAGPRHLVCHPGGKLVYVINELSNTIATCVFDGGELELVDEVSTLPADFRGENTAAEIALSPGTRFLYASNRGHDSIAYYSVDAATGALELQGVVSSQGEHPRNFAFTASGKYMVVANRDSNNVVLFKLDKESGEPVYTGTQVQLSQPMGIAFCDTK